MSGYDYLANVLKALGHPVRLQILQVLRDDEACVCHLEAALGQRQAYISQQLMRLREAGLVIDRRDGMNVYYALADEIILDLLDDAQTTARILNDAALSFDLPPGEPCPCPRCAVTLISEISQGETT